jgi:hypothetical protein
MALRVEKRLSYIEDVAAKRLKAMVGLSLKEISSSQSMDVQNDKLNEHKSAQQIVNKEENIFLHNNNNNK